MCSTQKFLVTSVIITIPASNYNSTCDLCSGPAVPGGSIECLAVHVSVECFNVCLCASHDDQDDINISQPNHWGLSQDDEAFARVDPVGPLPLSLKILTNVGTLWYATVTPVICL